MLLYETICPTLLKYTIDKPKQAEEDHYNDLLALFLNQSLRKIGWSAATQTRGGFTGRQTNGAGESANEILLFKMQIIEK